MKIGMVAVDLDGTLLGGTKGRYGMLPEAVEALRRIARNGAIVGFATGRDYPFMIELLKREGIDPAAEGWPHFMMEEERFIYELRDNGIYETDALRNDAVDRTEREHFRRIAHGVSDSLAAALAAIDPSCKRLAEEKELRRGFVELIFADAHAAREGETVVAEWLREQGLPYTAVRNGKGLSVRHVSVGKGAVLSALCAQMNVPPAETLAIGDGANDLTMLAGPYGFAAAAPGNADEEVKERVRRRGGYIAERRYGAGVAEAIRHYELHEAVR
ncbi:HAD family hydrolase [Paenibacillus sp. GYB003]|uniref:HAD family hydrolase n=1 Tax=Paenibacillus sp. GYB003 TaxID=2994392 RepID=UPI002F967E2E